MKNDFEKIYSKLDKFMESKNVTENNMQNVLDDFIKQYNNGTLNVVETSFDKAMDKFSEAFEAKTEKSFRTASTTDFPAFYLPQCPW